MYKEFFNLKEKPFSLNPDPEFLFLSKNHIRAQTMLEYGFHSQAGFTVITGDIGAGKTTLVNYLLAQEGDDVVIGVINNTHASFGNLMSWILDAFDLEEPSPESAKKLRKFTEFIMDQYAEGKRVLLVIDEAQNLSEETLEELRLISNINIASDVFLQLILIGQPELIEKLNDPRLTQFAQRIGVDFHLRPMDYVDTGKYIFHRLKVAGSTKSIFTSDAIAAIFCFSEGVPRRINTLCDMALVYAFADERKTINAQLIIDVIKDRNLSAVIRPTALQAKEVQDVAHWLQEVKGVNISAMLPGFMVVDC
ncbi:putative secretion ATPase, PEP-CTERM locus subfamily [Gammaproteobacteria bacterium MOLA455]|nr:putative secretion ATPase, PEP-CTERM locus subfamily [Gammaproteobacteria bacterium MOLA455]